MTGKYNDFGTKKDHFWEGQGLLVVVILGNFDHFEI